MARVFIDADLDYVDGYLRYGHKEGVVNIPDEDIEKFKEDPIKYILYTSLIDYLHIVVDDYEINDYGEITDINYQILED